MIARVVYRTSIREAHRSSKEARYTELQKASCNSSITLSRRPRRLSSNGGGGDGGGRGGIDGGGGDGGGGGGGDGGGMLLRRYSTQGMGLRICKT
jgi:hypothetical protein